MAQLSAAASEDDRTSVAVATWVDGSTVHSVVLHVAGRVEHEYWLIRDGQVLARFASLAAVDAWRAEGPENGGLRAA